MAPRQRVVIPANYLVDVKNYSMADWLDSKKHCPKREELLSAVVDLYSVLVTTNPGITNPDIREAHNGSYEILAKMLTPCLVEDNSLAEFIIEVNAQTLTADKDKWYDIYTAGAWLVVQTYFRTLVQSQDRGGR